MAQQLLSFIIDSAIHDGSLNQLLDLCVSQIIVHRFRDEVLAPHGSSLNEMFVCQNAKQQEVGGIVCLGRNEHFSYKVGPLLCNLWALEHLLSNVCHVRNQSFDALVTCSKAVLNPARVSAIVIVDVVLKTDYREQNQEFEYPRRQSEVCELLKFQLEPLVVRVVHFSAACLQLLLPHLSA